MMMIHSRKWLVFCKATFSVTLMVLVPSTHGIEKLHQG